MWNPWQDVQSLGTLRVALAAPWQATQVSRLGISTSLLLVD
jgi:hypothetical protein